jgi:hypothetical protein
MFTFLHNNKFSFHYKGRPNFYMYDVHVCSILGQIKALSCGGYVTPMREKRSSVGVLMGSMKKADLHVYGKTIEWILKSVMGL